MVVNSRNIYEKASVPLTEDYVARVVNNFINMSKNYNIRSAFKEPYKVFYNFLKNDPNKGNSVHDSVSDLAEKIVKSSIQKGTYTPFINEDGFQANPIFSTQLGWQTYQSWHLSNNKMYEKGDISHRFYISVDPSVIPNFIILLKEKFEKLNITYYFKVSDGTIIGNTQKDGLVIYSSTEDMDNVLSILKEIETEHPELIKKCNEPHLFCGNINGWIGYANEIKKEKNSYTNLMSKIMYDSIEISVLNWIRTHPLFTINENGKNIYLSEYFNSQIKSGETEIELINGLKEYIRKLGHLVKAIPQVDKTFKQEVYKTIKNNLIKNNFDPNNICFNFDVLKEINEYNSNIQANKNKQLQQVNERDYKAEYNQLLNSRNSLPNYNELVKNLKRKAWEYFRNVTNVINLESNMQKDTKVYSAPLLEIHSSNLVNWRVANGNEIYIDENFLKDPNNANIIVCQIMHEISHGLSQFKNKKQLFFGHETNEYQGIDEATTQMYAEDITKIRLSEEEDYMFPIKTFMRICKILVGEDKLASQYLNNDLSFEEKFNNISSGKFTEFAIEMNNIYKLCKQGKYGNNVDLQDLETKKANMLKFLGNIVGKRLDTRPEIIEQLENELGVNLFNNLKK